MKKYIVPFAASCIAVKYFSATTWKAAAITSAIGLIAFAVADAVQRIDN